MEEKQWIAFEDKCRDTGLQVKRLSATQFVIADSMGNRVSKEMYASNEAAALDVIAGNFTRLSLRIDSGVQHGKGKQQWAKVKSSGLGPMYAGSL